MTVAVNRPFALQYRQFEVMADNAIDYVAWAERVNSSWIAHRGLGNDAAAYMSRLKQTDPARLVRACRNAHLLCQGRGPSGDPKPWFYGGLFSLATPEEAKEFLGNHCFTAALVPSGYENGEVKAQVEAMSQETRDKITQIREAIARLP